ncbi:hypothetical protein [Nocardia sp. NPDC020380]|uniref:hypothetical protein n=1 Tax=Nocardia sp. NPDC020380 TaxID=3364309 RepID=UPI0037877A9C
MSDAPRRPPDKAVIFIYRPLAATKARLDWTKFYAHQRAVEQNLRVGAVVVADRIDEGVRELLNVVRRLDAGIVITPNLGHLGGSPVAVTRFAELLTVKPPGRFRWAAGEAAAREVRLTLALMPFRYSDIPEGIGEEGNSGDSATTRECLRNDEPLGWGDDRLR